MLNNLRSIIFAMNRLIQRVQKAIWNMQLNLSYFVFLNRNGQNFQGVFSWSVMYELRKEKNGSAINGY